ncbi:MAG TPA: capsule assembly Wzi family protein, partial [Terracidiphilus sp.]|nr:capsule assembly Wzi family protein [Terracidiphilus sp.]
MNRRVAWMAFIRGAIALSGLVLMAGGTLLAAQAGTPVNSGKTASQMNVDDIDCEPATQASPYIPVDSWVYPAVLRLYSLGYVDTVYLNMRPWTRASLGHMLEETADILADENNDSTTAEAQKLYDALKREADFFDENSCATQKASVTEESVYSAMRGITGTPLRDSFHLGSTIINDYGRPYANGFNNYSGASGYASAGRYLLYVRGEFHAAPSMTGYSSGLASVLEYFDGTTYYYNPACWGNESTPTAACIPMPDKQQTTMPLGVVASTTNARIMEAYVSAQYLNNVFSFGKQDDWLGPGLGGGMAYSNNAENIYSFRINRIEPLQVPFLSRLTGPFRYEFLIGSLKGHTYPADPWVHLEMVSFRPTRNLEFGFERTVIWGGKGHVPVTLKTFLRSFISLTAPQPAGKNSPADPGARFGAFDFSYRLPFVRNWLTLYTDMEAHDEVSPSDAPR